MNFSGFMSRCAMLAILLVPAAGAAQELVVPPSPDLTLSGEIVALSRGDRAPSDGMLILDADLVAWRQRIERLTFELYTERMTATAICAARVDQEHARLTSAEERLRLRDDLWGAEATRIAGELVEARAQAAAGPDFLEHPLLWFGLGFLAAGLAGVAIAAVIVN